MKRASIWLCVAGLAVVACSKKDTDKQQPVAEKTTAPPAPPPEPPKPAKKPLAELFSGATAALPVYVDKLKFGMTEDEAKAAAPKVMAAQVHYDPDDIEGGVQIQLHFSEAGKRVSEVFIKTDLPVAKLKELIAAKWGEPKAVKAGVIDWLFWSAPGLRVGLTEYGSSSSEIHYTPQLAAEQFYGTDPKLWGFERGKALIGSTADEVMTTYADWARKVDQSIYLEIPAVAGDYQSPSLLILLDIEKDKVVRLTFSVERTHEKTLIDRATQLYGKGRHDKDSEVHKPVVIDFKGPPKVHIEASDEVISLYAGKPRT